MKYQTSPRPLPSRLEEKEAMDKLREDWLAHPYSNIIINQNERTLKLDLSKKKNAINMQWQSHFLVGLVANLMVLNFLFKGRATRYLSGVPVFYIPKFKNLKISPATYQNIRWYKFLFPTTYVLSYIYADYSTNKDSLADLETSFGDHLKDRKFL